MESEHTATVGSGLYVELPEQTQPTSQCDASTVPTQPDNQDEETITVPRSNTEGVPENNVTSQGIVTTGNTEEVRSLPETREASTSMDEDVVLWTTAQSEGDEQSIILVAEPIASTTNTHVDDPPVRQDPPTQEERSMEPPVNSASEITEAKTEPVHEVEDERPPPAEEQENDDVPASTIVETVVEIHAVPTEGQVTTPMAASTTDSSISSIVFPGQATGGGSTAHEGVPTEVETPPTEVNSTAVTGEPHTSPGQPGNEAAGSGERLEQMPSAAGEPALNITQEPSVTESMVTANTGLTKKSKRPSKLPVLDRSRTSTPLNSPMRTVRSQLDSTTDTESVVQVTMRNKKPRNTELQPLLDAREMMGELPVTVGERVSTRRQARDSVSSVGVVSVGVQPHENTARKDSTKNSKEKLNTSRSNPLKKMKSKLNRIQRGFMTKLAPNQHELQESRQSVRLDMSQEWVRDTVKGITYETEPLGIGGQHIFFNVPLNLDFRGGVQAQYFKCWPWLAEVVFDKKCGLGQVCRQQIGIGTSASHFLWLIFDRVRGHETPDFNIYERGVLQIRDDAMSQGVTEIATVRPPSQACTRNMGKG